MRWKLFLGVFLVILLAGLLYSKYFNLAEIKLPNIKLPSSFSILANSMKPTKYSNVVLKTNKKSLAKHKFQLLNTTLKVSGICISSLQVEKTSIDLSNRFCNITIYSPEGEMSITNSGVMIVKSRFSKMLVNGIPIISPAEALFELAPTKLLCGVRANEVDFETYKGSIQKLTSSGEKVSEIYFPPCKKPKVYNFIGTLNLNGNSVVLSGVVSKMEYRCK